MLGISGSIAATETPRVIRELVRHGAEVEVVASSEATRLVTPEALEFASGKPPVTTLTGGVEHVSLLGPGEGRSDLLLLAPATANTISKIAHGIDDTPVTSCASIALGGGVPILLAPAMHAQMLRNPAVRENLQRLRQYGIGVVQPTSAEEEEKLASPEEIAAAVLHRLGRGPWAGRRVVVIGGASREGVDEVRSLTNESTGAMAVALAVQAHWRGAQVDLWAGSLQVAVPPFLSVRHRWRTVADLLRAVRAASRSMRTADAVFVPAALSDFTVDARPGKIASATSEGLTLRLRRAPKVLPQLRRYVRPPHLLVGFKLEAGRPEAELADTAERFRQANDLDWVVANDRAALGSALTHVLVIGRGRRAQTLAGPKVEVAGKLLDDLGRDLATIRPHPAAKRGAPAARRRRSRPARRRTR